jgi:hypothetical protein
VIQSDVDDPRRVAPLIDSFYARSRFSRHVDQCCVGISVDNAFKGNNEAIVEPAVQEPGPESNGVSAEFQFPADTAQEFGKNNVDRNSIGVEAVDTGTENKVVSQAPDSVIPRSPQMVRCEPPEKIEEEGAAQLGDSVPYHPRKIGILDVLAVDVNLKLLCQARYPLEDDALGPMLPIKERRHYSDPRLSLLPRNRFISAIHARSGVGREKRAWPGNRHYVFPGVSSN